VTEPWENTEKNPNQRWPVAEGAAVLKHKNTYYLFYTANHFKNPDYNVGYATSSSPFGPWTKYKGNPIIRQSLGAVGVGSGEFIRNKAGELLFFYHAHHNLEKVSPRKVVYSKVNFIPNPNGGPDIVEIENKKYFPST
jgi:xylan 1,4-beta-xylosidase